MIWSGDAAGSFHSALLGCGYAAPNLSEKRLK